MGRMHRIVRTLDGVRADPGDFRTLPRLRVGTRAGAGRDVLSRLLDPCVDLAAHFLVECSYGSNEYRRIRDDIRAIARVERAHGDDGVRRREVHLAADDGLKAKHDLRA